MERVETYMKFHVSGSYDYDIKYLLDTIKNYQEKWGLDLNPDFQRGHVWTPEQRVAFLEYWLSGGVVNPIYLNWPENLNKEKGYSDFVIVDGLQRLTTFMMFAKDEISIFNGIKFSDFENPLRMPSIPICKNHLKTKKEVLEWYYFMNSGGTPHSESELVRVKKMIETS